MSENWIFQLSLKIDGTHLLNIRGETSEDFEASLKWVTENKEPILIATAALGGSQRPAPAPTMPSPAPAPVLPAAAPPRDTRPPMLDTQPQEIGPLGIEKVDLKKGPKVKDASGKYVDGKPWKSPMYIVTFTNGTTASTFDASYGKAAMSLSIENRQCYATVEPSERDPKYLNLLAVRGA